MTATDEDDLRLLLRSPALQLDPAPQLAERVRSNARRVTRRRRGAAVVVSLTLVGAVASLGPTVATQIEDLRARGEQQAKVPRDARYPTATSEVRTLVTLNGAQVVTWWERSQWCTATSRVKNARTCVGPIDEDAPGIPRFLDAGTPSLTVDRRRVVAGVVGTGVRRVKVHLTDGREFTADFYEGAGFHRPVWAALLAGPAAPVAYVTGFDERGVEVARVRP